MNRGVFGLNNFDARDRQHMASVYLAAAQSVTSGVTTKVAFDTVEFDPYALWDAVNKRFIAKIAGYYRVFGAVRGGGATSTSTLFVYLYKNGSVYKTLGLIQSGSPTGDLQGIGSTLIQLNAGDYVEMDANVTGAGAITFSAVNVSTHFAIEFARTL